MPRYPLLGLPEFATIAALDHYKLRKHSAFGDFGELRANTRAYLKELMPDLEQLDRLIETPPQSMARCRATTSVSCRSFAPQPS